MGGQTNSIIAESPLETKMGLNQPVCTPTIELNDGTKINIVSTTNAWDTRLILKSGRTDAEYGTGIKFNIDGNTLRETGYYFPDKQYVIMNPDETGNITDDGDNLVYYLKNTRDWLNKTKLNKNNTLDKLIQCCKFSSKTSEEQKKEIIAKVNNDIISPEKWEQTAKYMAGDFCMNIIEKNLIEAINFEKSKISRPTSTIGMISTIAVLLGKKYFASKTSVLAPEGFTQYNVHTHSSYFHTGVPEIDKIVSEFDSFDNLTLRNLIRNGEFTGPLWDISAAATKKRDDLIEHAAKSQSYGHLSKSTQRPSPTNENRNVHYYNSLIQAINSKDYKKLYYIALDSCTQLPSRADINLLVRSKPLEFKNKKLRLNKIVYAGGASYYFHEPGSKYIGLILTDGNQYYQSMIRKKAFKD